MFASGLYVPDLSEDANEISSELRLCVKNQVSKISAGRDCRLTEIEKSFDIELNIVCYKGSNRISQKPTK